MKTPPLRICVVENHADTRLMMCMLLEQNGYVVGQADSQSSALALFDAGDYDVLISDIGLTDGDGWELLPKLLPTRPDLYAIAVSGYGAASDHQKSRAAGFRAHLIKPLEYRVLASLLQDAKNERDQRRG